MTKKEIKRKNFGFRHVVKRRGHKEKFDERKVYASVYEACHAAGLSTKQAEKMGEKTAAHIKKWMEKKEAVDAHEIHRETTRIVSTMNKDAGFMYGLHRDVC